MHLSLVSQYVYFHRKLVDKEILTTSDVSSLQNFSTCLLALKVVSATVTTRIKNIPILAGQVKAQLRCYDFSGFLRWSPLFILI